MLRSRLARPKVVNRLRGPQVLLIHGDDEWCARIAEMLRANEVPSSRAHDGATGVRIARKELPQIVICEWDLRDMHGFDVMTCLRLDRVTAWIPVIIVAAEPTSERRVAALAAGAQALVGPDELERDIVRAVVRAILS